MIDRGCPLPRRMGSCCAEGICRTSCKSLDRRELLGYTHIFLSIFAPEASGGAVATVACLRDHPSIPTWLGRGLGQLRGRDRSIPHLVIISIELPVVDKLVERACDSVISNVKGRAQSLSALGTSRCKKPHVVPPSVGSRPVCLARARDFAGMERGTRVDRYVPACGWMYGDRNSAGRMF